MYDINSISEIVAELGGPSKLGALLGVTSECVSNWIARDYIPGGWHMQIAAMLHRNGKSIDPKVFKLTEKDVEGLLPFKRPLGRRHRQSRAASV